MRQAAKRRYSHHRRREGGPAAKPYGGGRSGGPAAPPRHTLATAVDEPDQREVPVEVWSVERRRRRREERRKRYESVMGLVLKPGSPPVEEVLKRRGGVDVDVGGGIPPLWLLEEQQREQRVQEIEERWQQVEKAAIRQERRVPLYPETPAKDVGQLERLLHNYKRRVSLPCRDYDLLLLYYYLLLLLSSV